MVVTVERATLDHAEDIVQMAWDAEDWLLSKGVEPASGDGVSLADVREQIEIGEWNIALFAGIAVAAARVLNAPPALHVACVMIDRKQAGPGLGAQLLRWVDEKAGTENASLVRVECAESNKRLRGYYEEQGFSVAGRTDIEGQCPDERQCPDVVVLEKSVA